MMSRQSIEEGSEFTEETFENLELNAFDFSDKQFFQCQFVGCNFEASSWNGARLEDCTFVRCDVTRMSTAGLRLHGVTFRSCKVMGVEWTAGALQPDLCFQDCNLRYCSFLGINLRGARFLRSQVTETQFHDLDLRDADFSDSDLSGAIFSGATLSGADFRTTRGAFLDPAKNKVKGARIGAESAALLATHFGMSVVGFSAPKEAKVRKR